MSGKLTILTQWYPPEQAPFGRMMQELAADLVRRGWEVTVITGFPNHPLGEVFGGYRKRWCLEEMSDGVRVHRVWLATLGNRGIASRLATFASFTASSTWRLLRNPRPDVIFAVLQPLSVGLTVPFVARLKRSALVFNLQDLHPDTQIRLGMVRHPWLIRILRAIERYAYRSCSALSVICEPFRVHAVRRGAPADRVHVIGNWIDVERIHPVSEGQSLRGEAGFNSGHFVVLWAGTLGYVSGAAIVVEAAERLRDRADVRFLVVGEGPLKEELQSTAASRRLENIAFMPFQAEEHLCALQSTGDASLVTLSADFAESSVPSKLIAYMAAGRAVVAAVPGHSPTADLVRISRSGVVVGSDDADALAAAIASLADNPAQARQLGDNARDYAVRHLSREATVDCYDDLFRKFLQAP